MYADEYISFEHPFQIVRLNLKILRKLQRGALREDVTTKVGKSLPTAARDVPD